MAFFQSNSLWVQHFAEGVAVLQFDPAGKTVRLTLELLDEIDAALQAVEAEPKFQSLVVRSLQESSFCQGPDFTQWRAMKAPDDFRRWAERGQAVWNRLRNLRIPTLAWVQGACLGAGLELALACDRIVVIDKPSTILGYNELDLGLIPSWGSLGTLVRRIGLENAFPLVLAGRRVTAREAIPLGLADPLVVDPNEEPDFRFLGATAQPRDRNLWQRRTWRQKWIERFSWGRRLLVRGIRRLHARRLPEELPAPGTALQVLLAFIDQGQQAGQVAARDALVQLAQSPAHANLLRLHDLRERYRVTPGKLGVPVKPKTIGILGATPLAFHLILEIVRRGSHVILRESDETRLGVSILKLVQTLNREIQEGRMTSQDSQKCLSRIRSTITWKNFDEVDFVVDARDGSPRQENPLAEVDQQTTANVPILVASARGRVEAIVHELQHSGRVFGMNVPIPLGDYPIVEWRRTANADEGLAKKSREWLGGLGLTPIETADEPGQLLIRLWVPAWNEMILLLREGASVEIIDQAMARFGVGRGPLEYLDHIGLEKVRSFIDMVRDDIEPRITIEPFWNEVLERGWRGKASGRGFYRYGRGKPQPNHLLVNWLRLEGPKIGDAMPALSVKEQIRFVQKRIVSLMVNESFRCLGEQRVRTADELDLACMLADWAPHRGGPIRYAEQTGLDHMRESLRSLEKYGARYAPCPALQERQ